MEDKPKEEFKPKIDVKTLKTIIKYSRLGKEEAQVMEDFIKEHIDPKCKICRGCPNQLRFALKRIKAYGKLKGYE